MVQVLAGIGSNLEPRRNLRLAVRELRQSCGPLRLSTVYRNGAVGFDGADFLNMAVAFESTLDPAALDERFEAIHRLAGRVRDGGRLQSRTLDIDLLMYGDAVSEEPPLPRADILDYNFVLVPLAEIAPDVVHPLTGRSLREHARDKADDLHTLRPVALGFD